MTHSLKIIKYELKNHFKSRFILLYFIFFLSITTIFFQLSNDVNKVLISLTNIILFFVPLMTLIYANVSFYNSLNFVRLLLTQPIKRFEIALAIYLSLVLSMGFALFFGILLPSILFITISDFFQVFLLASTGVLLSFIFTGIAILISNYVDDKSKGIGLSLITWFILAVLYDGIVMFIVFLFSEYPLDKFILGLTAINPIDLARIFLLIQFNISAFLGYTGALFQKIFNEFFGHLILFTLMFFWIAIPFILSQRKFLRKDF